ncbi:MAG: MBL fold metallo-hydrolase [Ruminococcus sp.]|nr:MBL fold metallo-hydrolase [Ruminococcus sp.]
MRIHTLQLGELRSNCYIAETAPGRAVAVDIGGDSRLFLEFIKMKKIRLTKILLTHGHFDHIGGVEEVRAATGAEVYIHESDAPMLKSPSASLHSTMSIYPFKEVTDYTVVTGDCYINDADCTFRVFHTPGHSHGSVCYICDDVMFSGDTLFCASIGRTDFPGSDHNRMMWSLARLYELEEDYIVLPGHGERTSLDYEKDNNPYFRSFR